MHVFNDERPSIYTLVDSIGMANNLGGPYAEPVQGRAHICPCCQQVIRYLPLNDLKYISSYNSCGSREERELP